MSIVVGSGSPWGVVERVTAVGRSGIVFVSTMSHGGYYVPREVRLTMPAPLRDYMPFVQRGGGASGWYEEDLDWAVVCLAFPADFPPEALPVARGLVNAGALRGLTRATLAAVESARRPGPAPLPALSWQRVEV